MSRLAPIVTILCCAAGLAGCDRGTSTQAPTHSAGAATIQQAMVESLAPQSTLLWEISAKLYADSGEIDATLLRDQDWSAMRQAAEDMRAVSLALQESPPRVAAPGAKLQGEEGAGALTAVQIQALIDAEPEVFAAEAGKLVEVADGFMAAIAARDGAAIDELSGRLNEVCSACHLRFWFPDQAAP